jgi:hypothetical protein
VNILDSARRHGVADEDIEHAVAHALVVADDADAERVLYLGPDRAGNLLEIVSVRMDDESAFVIDAMDMRKIYDHLLSPLEGTDE